MRIGITCHPTAGGSGILATELGLALARNGHTVHFVTLGTPFRLTEFSPNLYVHTAQTISYPVLSQAPGELALATKIADVADEYGVDLWHAHYAIPHAASAVLARDMLPEDKKFKIVTTLHGTDITLVGADPSFRRTTQYAMERSDAVTAVSYWLKAETEREFELSKPVLTIHNFVDTDRFLPGCRRDCFCQEGEKVIMHVSNFRAVKRVTDVVRVFRKVLDKTPARLVMVGEGPEKLSAVGVAKQLGIMDKITFLGNHANIEQILPCADLILQPSEHESFGLVALEAMSCEIPVVATAAGGTTEVVEHAITGYLCEVGDIDAMAGYAVCVLNDPEHAAALGQAGRVRALQCFPRDKMLREYEDLYKRLCS